MNQTNEELLKMNAELDAQIIGLTKMLDSMLGKMDAIEAELIQMRLAMGLDSTNKDDI